MDVSDFHKRLTFPDQAVQCRAISKLLDAFIKRKTQGKSTIEQSPEISLLLEACASNGVTAPAFAVQGVISLVLNGYMHTDFVVKQLLSVVPSAKNISVIINGIAELLLTQADKVDESNSMKYSLQHGGLYPKHPFITVLETSPDSWPLILETVSANFLSKGNSANSSFLSMVPLLDYVLLNPQGNIKISSFKHSLLQGLLCAYEGNSSEILDYFCHVLPWLQVNNSLQCAESLHFLSKFKEILIRSDVKDNSMILNLIFISLGLISSSIDQGMTLSSFLDIVEELCSSLGNIASSYKTCGNCCFAVISILLSKSYGDVTLRLLNIGLLLLEKVQPNRMVASMTFIPTVQLSLEPKIMSFKYDEKVMNILTQFTDKLQTCLKNRTSYSKYASNCFPIKYSEAINMHCLEALLCVNFTSEFENWDDETKMSWLLKAKKYLNASSELVSDFMFNMVAGLLFLPSSKQMRNIQLEVLEVICDKNCEMSTRMFSLLIYKQSSEKDPEILLLILEYLSRTASHKYAVAPVLNILQMMFKHQELKSQAAYLMYHLWKKQDRCFLYLENFLVEKDLTVSLTTGVPEFRLAQISIIKKLCSEVPNKCSGPFLGTLSNIINESTSEASTPAAVLALDAVIALCTAEVIDLRSAWKALAPKLGRDRRPLISAHVCELLSLVPKLVVKSCAYDKFMNEVVVYLWRTVSRTPIDSMTLGAAYKALSTFPADSHNLKLLPAIAKVNLKLPPSMISTPLDMGKSPEDVLTYIPGYCFGDLLRHYIDRETLEGYSCFLQSVVMQEVVALPQSVYFKRKPISRKHDSSDVLAKIPGILCSQFDLIRSTVVQKNLAVGILLSYEPPMQYDKEGKLTKNCIASHCSMYEQIFEMLLNEVSLDPNDWQRCLLLPQGWRSFMEKAFFACEESNRVGIDLQKSSGRLKCPPEEINLQLETAWLWVRNRFLHLIKVTSKTTANAAANSVFALAGLMNAAEKFYSGLDHGLRKIAADCTKYISHQDFLIQSFDTIISVWDSNHKCSTKLLELFQTQSQSSSASYLVKGCAGASLSNIAHLLKLLPNVTVQHCFDILFANMSGASSALSLFSGIGFGSLMKVVTKDSEILSGGNKADFLLETAERLNYLCKDEDLKPGKMIALALCISSLSAGGDPMYTTWIKEMCQSFHNRLMEENPSSMEYEFLALCTSAMSLSASSAGIQSISDAENLLEWFEDNRKDMPQCSSTASAMGLLSDGLQRLGSSKGSEMAIELKDVWLGIVRSEKKPTLQRMAALNGLCSLFSAGKSLVQISSDMSAPASNTGLRDLVQLMIQFLNASRDSGLQSLSCWELGVMHAVHTNVQNESSTESSSYSYLSERSILKPLIKLVEGYFTGEVSRCHITIVLEALGQKFPRPLPPLDWVKFLSPLLQQMTDTEIIEAALKIAINQMPSSSSARGVFSSYAAPPLLFKLPVSCHSMFLKNLVTISSSFPPAKLASFLQAFLLPASTPIKDDPVMEALIFECLQEAHGHLNSNQGSKKVLEDVFKDLILSRSFEKIRTYLDATCKISSQMNEECLEDLFQHLRNNDSLCVEMLIISNLVRIGKKPLAHLKSCLTFCKHEDNQTKSRVIFILLRCIIEGKMEPTSEISKTENVIDLLMETMGWITVLLDSSNENRLESNNEVIQFLNNVCLAIIIGSSSCRTSYATWSDTPMEMEKLIQLLPVAVCDLMHNSSWNDHMDKIIDWLIKWENLIHVKSEEEMHYGYSSLCALRTSEAYHKSKWAKIVCMLK